MNMQMVQALVEMTLDHFASRFRATNICDDWEEYFPDSTREEQDEARKIVESLAEIYPEIAGAMVEAYLHKVKPQESKPVEAEKQSDHHYWRLRIEPDATNEGKWYWEVHHNNVLLESGLAANQEDAAYAATEKIRAATVPGGKYHA